MRNFQIFYNFDFFNFYKMRKEMLILLTNIIRIDLISSLILDINFFSYLENNLSGTKSSDLDKNDFKKSS